MLKRFSDKLIAILFRRGQKNWPAMIVAYVVLLLPVVIIGILSYLRIDRNVTDLVLSRRESIAFLAAEVLEQRFNRLTDIAVSLASRVRFRQLIEKGEWGEAIQILSNVPRDFPFIERVFFTDPSGTLMGDTPAIPAVKGKNFAFRDWYQGISTKWEPYVSLVYKRTAQPQYNVVAVAAPIKSDEQKIIGILVLQVRLEALFEWSKEVEVGPFGFVYFVDRIGQIAAHPEYPPQAEIIDYSGVPVVQKVLQGKRGVGITSNAIEEEERVSAYAPVRRYGWGAVVQQPAAIAFSTRNASLRFMLLVYFLIISISCALAYLIFHTLSRLKGSEEDAHKLNTQLKAANQDLESFTRSISHDLRAPVRHIHGFASILHQRAAPGLDTTNRHYLDMILESAQHLENLINDLVSLSRLGRAEIQKREVDLNQTAREVVDELRSEMNGRSIAWKMEPLPKVLGDPSMLRVALSNLIANAVKFTRTRPDARIEIGATNSLPGQTVVYVSDNGVGFDMRYLDKLFGVFQRLHSSTEFEGTGIGLASVRHAIERHGGRTWAEGKLGDGAMFYFSLPMTDEPEKGK